MTEKPNRLYRCLVRSWPLAAALVVVWVATMAITLPALEHEDHLTYTLDDSYIQMAIAKNVVEHGSWGLNPGEFNSTSSSPLWVILLSLIYLVIGVNDMVPFVLNAVFVMLVEVALFFILRKNGLSPVYNFLVLLAVALFAPLAPLVLMGMEHALQILLAVLFAYLAARLLSAAPDGDGGNDVRWLLALAPAVVLCRLESIFLVAIIAALLMVTGRRLLALATGALGILPIAAYGVYSVANGGMILPNSVILKGNVPLLPLDNWVLLNIRFIPTMLKHIIYNPVFLTLSLASAAVLLIAFNRRSERYWRQAMMLNMIFLAGVILHFQTNTSQNYRYEAYLVVIGIMAVAMPVFRYLSGWSWPAGRRSRLALAAAALPLALALLAPVVYRSEVNHRLAPLESRRIFEQQIQMGRFLDRYYTGKVVAANDVGAINFYADIVCVDLWGLGSNDIARTRMEIRGGALFDEPFVLSQQQIYDIGREKGTDIAMVYHEIFELEGESRIPDEWVFVGRWQIYRYERDYWDKVSIYAVDPDEEQDLLRNLREFSPELPVFVRQEGPYTVGL
ncbi:MAG: hypothetical protein ACYC4M_04115 [Thermoleophilia bacterium]